MNARSLLTDNNKQVVTAAAELMSNLVLTETISSRIDVGKANVELESMLSLLNHSKDNDKLAFAALSFFANSVSLEPVQNKLISNDKCLAVIFQIMIKSESEGVWHRVLYILDEVKEKTNLKKVCKTVSKDDIERVISKIVATA